MNFVIWAAANCQSQSVDVATHYSKNTLWSLNRVDKILQTAIHIPLHKNYLFWLSLTEISSIVSNRHFMSSISFGWWSKVDLEIIHHMAKSHFLWLPWNKIHIIYVWILFWGSPGLYLERGMGASLKLATCPPNFGKSGDRSPHIWQNVIKHLYWDVEGESPFKTETWIQHWKSQLMKF